MRPFDQNGAFRPTLGTAQGGLRRTAIRAAGITTVSQGLGLVVQVVATVVLARLLDPADFGLVAMVTTFSLLFVNFGGNGITEAVVQREEISHALASNLFWVTTSISLLLSLGFAASGSLLARFYRDPRITSATAMLAVTILLTGLSVLHLALLRRAMRFFVVSMIAIVAQASSVIISILLARRGWGYWALIGGAIATPLTTSIGAWMACQWMPGLPRRGVGTGTMVRFAMHIYGFFALNYVTRNVDNLLVGSFFGPQPLGLYKKAYDLANLPYSQVSSPLTSVAVPTLSRLKDEPERHARYLLRCFSILAFIGMGISACLTVAGKDLIVVLLGPRWVQAGTIFTVFAPGIAALFLYGINGWIHLSIGRADRYFRWGIVECTLLCLALLLGVKWGPIGLATAWTSYYWLLAIPAIYYAGQPVDFKIGPVVRAVWKYLAASVLAATASTVVLKMMPAFAVTQVLQAAIRLALACVSFTVFYLAAVVALYQGCTPIYQLIDLLREVVPWERFSRLSPVAATSDN